MYNARIVSDTLSSYWTNPLHSLLQPQGDTL
jgi:hypothetical protein